MLKLPKGLKKKKKKSKKDQELFTEEELEEYKRQLKAKQEAAAAKSDAGESDAASDVEGLASSATTSHTATTSELAQASTSSTGANETNEVEAAANGSQKPLENDDEWARFKALTSGVDTILHKTQDELDRIKKESFYQRLPSAAEKKKLEEEEAARREAERLEEEKRLAAEKEANRDKLAEAVVELSESEGEDDAEVDDIFDTNYTDAITSGELQLVVPDSPVLDFDDGPDPFDTAYAEKVIVGADKAKGNKKLVSLGAAVEVLSGRVEREKALELTKPSKRKLRKGIKNLLLSESVDQGDADEEDLLAPEPQRNLLDELVDDIPDNNPIDLSVSLHLSFLPPKKVGSDDEEGDIVDDLKFPDLSEFDTLKEDKKNGEETGFPDLSEFDTLKTPEDDEFAELAAESLHSKKVEAKVITEIPLPKSEVLTNFVESDWAEFERLPGEEEDNPKRPPPRPTSGPHLAPGVIFVSDDEDEQDDDPFNTTYAEQVIKKTTVLEEDDDFDPRAEEKAAPPGRPPPPEPVKLLAKHFDIDIESEDFDPFDTRVAGAVIVLSKTTLKQSLSDPDFDPRAEETTVEPETPAKVSPPTTAAAVKVEEDFDTARRKSSLSLSLQSNKSVGFLVPNQDLLGAAEGGSNKKPLTPYYAPTGSSISEKEDPFDTSYVPENKPSDVELKHLEDDLLAKPGLESDPDFDPRAPPTPVPAEDLLSVKENINTKVLTPAQESKDLPDDSLDQVVDPFDTSIAANLQPGQAELKLLESELLPERISDVQTGVLDTQSDAQELGLGDKVLTPQLPHKQIAVAAEVDPFDTSIAENLQPGETEIKLLENELIDH